MRLYRGAGPEEAIDHSGGPKTATYWTPDRATAEQYADEPGKVVLEHDATGEPVIDWDHPTVQRYRPAWLPSDASHDERAVALASLNAERHFDGLEDYLWIRVPGDEDDIWVAM